MILEDTIRAEISELLTEAAEARELAAAFKGGAAVADLIAYALALEAEAVKLEEDEALEFDSMLRRGPSDRPAAAMRAHDQASGFK